ncbi:hypothetical protein E2P81_ATG05859 [Venturia nashicola]|uniref:Ph domain-containing protein n=1 Tax=Venturia nashicola TaxID=86259 RepID=A0A4Z1P3W9_9PEZI|nr:hypothetical protein E6O75_ATG06006 [Venturia nashicola]TLD29565.1 hypothetical protein E2P81_ATG05859 [Venturia nashicola]
MAAVVGKYAAKKMLSKQLNQYKDKEPAGQYDPYYEYRTNPRTGKQKKYKKQIPAYIPEHDADVLASVRKRAYRLDMSLFNFMGIRFGWSSVIGIVPAAGDAIDGAMALNLVRKCMQVTDGLPSGVIMNMLVWVIIDFVIGLVPFVGDILDASIKANSKNVRILEEHLDKKYKPSEIARREKEAAEEAKRKNQEYHPPAPATVYEDMSDDDDRLPQYSTRPHSPNLAANGPSRPSAARVPAETRGGTRDDRPRSSRHNDGRPSREPSRRERDRQADMAQQAPLRSNSRRH